MGASTEDVMNQLQGTLATPPQPSLFGIQAPPDPAALQALLRHLQAQKAVEDTGNTPGPYGYLHDAGQKAFASIGQQLGGAVGGALNTPGQFGNAAPAPDPRQAMASAIQQAQQTYQKLIANGVDENQARTTATKQLVQAGVPGAAEVLAKANTQGLDNAFKVAETAKDTSQSKMDDASIDEKARQEKQNTWTTIKETPEYTIQKNGLGEVRSTKVSDRASLPQTPEESANSDSIAQKIANYDLQMSDAVGRGNVQQRQDMLARVLKVNPDYDVKNFKQSADALRAYGPAGVQGQLVLKTQNAMNHLKALDEWGKALKNGDSTTASFIGNELAKQFNDPALSSYDTAASIVANEVSGAIVKGGGGVQERLARVKDFSDTKNDASRASAIGAARSLLGAQYKNNKNFYEKTTLRKDFEDRFPVEGGFPPPPGTNGAAATPTAGADGWTVMPNGVKVRIKSGS